MLDLTKPVRTYFVIADDECIGVPGCHEPGFERFRNILLVEAAPIDKAEYEAREEWHREGVEENQSPLSFLIYQAVSSKDAVRQARRAYEADRAEEDAEMRRIAVSRAPDNSVHKTYGSCDATWRRVRVIYHGRNQPTEPGFTSQFGHPPCGAPGTVRFVKVAQAEYYRAVYGCPEHTR
ncbi:MULTISPECIES: hypothetical protein [unclassified Streptomyces]|uniref:hypothetical protein n=1 Tax=unclassified Streptomyces TaxID=2593676 RepID=UPI002272029C|nr:MULTISPECIES: hypothetical protein [unclassified Streptomyces]MCY0924216.1 hypothetical protein [Streptomyces sp. H27-G5]MCY0963244.1 hypothetical protein [Streptomyces sp. H27-H5]